MTTKAVSQTRHAQRRFLERTGLEVSKRELRGLSQAIRTERGRFVERQSLRVTVWDVPFEGRTFRVVYDKKRKTIVTVLPDQGGWA